MSIAKGKRQLISSVSRCGVRGAGCGWSLTTEHVQERRQREHYIKTINESCASRGGPPGAFQTHTSDKISARRPRARAHVDEPSSSEFPVADH
ncbi:hypothetical protein EVAR_16929_1 [Eumeta japonica]|uniref:Uncharacterized protein n=1 Tax=Eumeta variegata TaxID=151549 RepID=A0A4C1TVC9_EUMVA|nr:hypothetical protein EVAR_16929_1 [Eumeta japonica]